MTCPICGQKTVQEVRPFCSKRCADVDLARWFSGVYAVPSRREEEVEDPDQTLDPGDGRGSAPKSH
jgi:endogenous inhibitor of DNA gyrase (YacG/DUF329 family)